MPRLITLIFIICLLVCEANIVLASEEKDFSSYMRDWTEKKELASKLLRDAENAFKAGDELSGCALQVKASNKGIDATQSLIKAMEINGSTDGLENLEFGLNKWKQLATIC